MALFPTEISPIALFQMTRYHSAMNSFACLVLLWQSSEMEGRRHFSHQRTDCHKVGEIDQNQKSSPLKLPSKEYFGTLNLHDILPWKKEIPFHSQSEKI